MQLYADLINPASRYSFRWQTNMIKYLYSRLKMRIFGKDKILKDLEEKMFKYKEEDCNKYILRWGGVPLISDKEYYGKGRESVFEDTKFIIPEKAEDYLTWHYGDNWMFLPDHAERSTHNAVYCYDTSYDVVKRDAYQYYDLNKLYNVYLRRKTLLFLGMHPWNIFRKIDAKKRKAKYNLRFNKLIEKKKEEIIKYAKLKEYGKIRKIFKKYINIQNKRGVIGREDYSGIYRFRNPILIDIPDDYFDIILGSLIANGDTSLALRFINVKEKEKGLNITENKFKEYILAMQDAVSLYACKNYSEAENIVDRLIEVGFECISVIKLKIRLLQQKQLSEREILEWIRKGENLERRNSISKNKKDGELLKYRADVVTKPNNINRIPLYFYAYNSTNNGIIKLEIRNYFEEHLNNTIEHILDLSKQENKKSLYYTQELCKIIPNNDKLMSILGECTFQFKKKPKDIWNIVYTLRKYIENHDSNEYTSECMKKILSSISENENIGEIYYRIIFTSSLNDLKEIYILNSILIL